MMIIMVVVSRENVTQALYSIQQTTCSNIKHLPWILIWDYVTNNTKIIKYRDYSVDPERYHDAY